MTWNLRGGECVIDAGIGSVNFRTSGTAGDPTFSNPELQLPESLSDDDSVLESLSDEESELELSLLEEEDEDE
jgi:hypothetical protein